MKKSRIRGLFFGLLAVGCWIPATSWTASQSQMIDALVVRPQGYVKIVGVSVWKNYKNCQDSSFAVLPSSHAMFREAYAMLLVAHTEQIKVKLAFTGCKKYEDRTRPEVGYVKMY